MALIKCPECSQDISTTAKSCPHCGFSINMENKKEGDLPAKQINNVVAKEGCFLQTLNIGCIIVIIVVAIIALVIYTVLNAPMK